MFIFFLRVCAEQVNVQSMPHATRNQIFELVAHWIDDAYVAAFFQPCTRMQSA